MDTLSPLPAQAHEELVRSLGHAVATKMWATCLKMHNTSSSKKPWRSKASQGDNNSPSS
jgi:hypothetical protein